MIAAPMSARTASASAWLGARSHGGHQLLGILEDLPFGRAARFRLFLGFVPALIFHFALLNPMAATAMSPSLNRVEGGQQASHGLKAARLWKSAMRTAIRSGEHSCYGRRQLENESMSDA